MAKRQLDDAALAELLGVPAERVRGWREQEIKVSPVLQLRLAEQLRCSHRELFAMGDASNGRWGVGLRNWLDRTGITSQAAAERLGEPVKRVRDWIELVSPVSPECQRYFEETLKPDVDPFREKRPDKGLWAVGLRQALREKGETAEDLARQLDTNVERVYDWMAMDDSGAAGRVAKPTRERISKYVGKAEESLFSDQRPEAEHREYRELIGKSFMEAADAYVAKEYGHSHTEETVVAKIAEELGVEAQEIERWRKGERKVPAGTAERVGALLGGFTAGSLFQ
jgi:plasmid maintenance system antidote protein VapI